MTEAPRSKDAHIFDRDPLDFYSEPRWCVDLLIEAERFTGRVWDPACGNGTIGRAFAARNHQIWSTDKSTDRPYGLPGVDFLSADADVKAAHIVCNPPFGIAEAFIRRGVELAGRSASFLLPLKWLASDARQRFFAEVGRPARVYVLADRASMPPGRFLDPETGKFAEPDPTGKGRWKVGGTPSGGSIDYCWVVFVPRYGGPTDLRWLSKSTLKGAHAVPVSAPRKYSTPRYKSAPEGALNRDA